MRVRHDGKRLLDPAPDLANALKTPRSRLGYQVIEYMTIFYLLCTKRLELIMLRPPLSCAALLSICIGSTWTLSQVIICLSSRIAVIRRNFAPVIPPNPFLLAAFAK